MKIHTVSGKSSKVGKNKFYNEQKQVKKSSR
jgi:hypothetical protein